MINRTRRIRHEIGKDERAHLLRGLRMLNAWTKRDEFNGCLEAEVVPFRAYPGRHKTEPQM